jgi:hypothetical protein
LRPVVSSNVTGQDQTRGRFLWVSSLCLLVEKIQQTFRKAIDYCHG